MLHDKIRQIDYIEKVSYFLEQFKRRGEDRYNFRCPYCGDSQKDRTKARAWLTFKEPSFFFYCYNCGHSDSFERFIRHVDGSLHKEYTFAKIRNRKTNTQSELVVKPKARRKDSNVLFDHATPISLLDSTHTAVKYCETRKIPPTKWHLLYWIDDYSEIVETNSSEGRIIFPFYNFSHELTGWGARSLNPNSFLRYHIENIVDNDDSIFGLTTIDRNQPVFVLEGQFDSLFVPNAVAVGGSSKILPVSLSFSSGVCVYDNEPRSFATCKLMKKAIESNSSVVIFPEEISEKDVNDMILGGTCIDLNDHIYSGMGANIQFNRWKKC